MCDFCVARFRGFVCSPFLLVCCVFLRWLAFWSSVQASRINFDIAVDQVWISTGWMVCWEKTSKFHTLVYSKFVPCLGKPYIMS